MSALARDIDRPPQTPSRDRPAQPLLMAPRFVHPDVAVPLNAGYEDPRATAIRGNTPRLGPRFSDRQLLSFIAVVALLIMASHELRYSSAQAQWWAQLAQGMHFEVAPGPGTVAVAPDAGPFDLRLGYAQLPQRVAGLRSAGFEVTHQARPSSQMMALQQRGLDVIYPEKAQAGLTLFDRAGRTIYSARYPRFVYDRFESIPPLVVSSLLFVEDREFLDGRWNRNPVMDWERLSKAAGLRLLSYAGIDDPVIGGSTLATQLEKFRHSPGGRTETVGEKLRQMASASVRIYRDGVDNQQTRRQLVADYINSLPLAGRADQGEIIGLGDGLLGWYGEDFGRTNDALRAAAWDPRGGASAYKRVLSLLVAARRPSYYLGQSPAALEALTNSYLRVLATAGVISPELRDAAIAAPLAPRVHRDERTAAAVNFVAQKDINLARARLANLLDVDGLYADFEDKTSLISALTLDAAEEMIASDALSSGMIPKVAACTHALKGGVRRAHILNGTIPHALLLEVYTEEGVGTMIRHADEPWLADGASVLAGAS